ncbi:2OG-Fe(II) oxygenase [Pontixanthobacter aestiaquae]|uniref:Fe2OG dioxygenase domain-containing protein n=1 Tax=Pontixanthobacter aestiaquae TaxID=1509367 RepID=A0A844ZE71_9SPHN|nr:2OG-Fe(II) oxygenase [Pontixanthobacter aestiaquae]MDN3644930.1 2OG-Fe(II) oxygenase [Pontixanthobacter aestiaquae]MXO84069.1 hypothetical protein [Pontixanthobacter aestiaquae]
MFTKFGVFDDAFGSELPARLLDFAIANEDGFETTMTSYSDGSEAVDTNFRTSKRFVGKLGDIGREYRAAFVEIMPKLFEAAGVPMVENPLLENELIATGDGGSLAKHIDTLTLDNRDDVESERILSTVYYFHRQPRKFSGGEIEIHPLDGRADPKPVEPRHGRLIVFPAFAPHSVRGLTVPSRRFEDGRFSLNCWVRYRTR